MTIGTLAPVLRGWVAYFRLADVRGVFNDLDQWVQRKLRAARWRQWKVPWTRYKELRKRGLDHARAKATAYSGRGPWRSARASGMIAALPAAELRTMGLVSLANEHRRLACSR